MLNQFLVLTGKTVSKISQTLNRGNGSTWPGHIALKGNPNFIKNILADSPTKVIIVAGTNGKTTTTSLIRTGLEKNGRTVLQNVSGANLLNGIASALLLNTNAQGKLTQDYAIFEVDENALPLVLEQITPDFLLLLNLFRDQLDRYGEINTITEKWQKAIAELSPKTKLILNADDPQIAYLGFPTNDKNDLSIVYFSLEDEKSKILSLQAADSVSCPRCGNGLTFETVTFSHLGKWQCGECGLQQPKPAIKQFPVYPLSGTYNKYNTHAAALVLREIGISETNITNAFSDFKPAFGRQEIIMYQGKRVQLFLSKNPTSFNQSYATIKELGASTILFVLNDRIPDGKDISWIWDTDLADLDKFKQIHVSGDRVYDMALRIKYELETQNYNSEVKTFEQVKNAIDEAIESIRENETVYILPTYSAMLDVRKILTGKKIL